MIHVTHERGLHDQQQHLNPQHPPLDLELLLEADLPRIGQWIGHQIRSTAHISSAPHPMPARNARRRTRRASRRSISWSATRRATELMNGELSRFTS